MHAKHLDQWVRVADVLEAGDPKRWLKRVDRLRNCCLSPSAFVTGDGKPVLCLGRCRDRLCPLCLACRARQTGLKLALVVQKMNAPRFITLTLKDDDRSLSDRLDHLFNSFKALRRLTAWRDRVTGGLYTVEITTGSRGDSWHVHLHLIVDGFYFPQALLSESWSQATNGSTIVDIRAIPDRERSVRYITKYVSKAADFAALSDSQLLEYADGVHRRRMFSMFGKYHNSVTDADVQQEKPSIVNGGITANRLRYAARRGCLRAVRACTTIMRAGGVWARAFGLVDRSHVLGERVQITELMWNELAGDLVAADAWLSNGCRDATTRASEPKKRDATLFGDPDPPAAQRYR